MSASPSNYSTPSLLSAAKLWHTTIVLYRQLLQHSARLQLVVAAAAILLLLVLVLVVEWWLLKAGRRKERKKNRSGREQEGWSKTGRKTGFFSRSRALRCGRRLFSTRADGQNEFPTRCCGARPASLSVSEEGGNFKRPSGN